MRTAAVEGGEVVFRDPRDVTAGAARGVQARLLVFGVDRFRQVVGSGCVDTGELPALLGCTAADAERVGVALAGISDAVTWALMESWTLPRPFPATPTAYAALPSEVKAALAEASRSEGAALVWQVI